MWKRTAALLLGLLLPSVGLAAPPTAPNPPREKLVLLSDGKKHYIALIPGSFNDDSLLYGDGKRFYSVPIRGGSAVDTVQFNILFVDPRFYLQGRQQSEVTLQDKKYAVTCGSSTTALTPVEDKEAKALLAAATFVNSPRTRKAYALARSNDGVYYFVDQGRTPETEKNFRLFIGPKGRLKLQQMTNIVSDSEGDVFSTKTGSMRLVLGKKPPVWEQSGKQKQLLPVPIEENLAMIYTDLGVYRGEIMGTPCDDL